MRRRLLFSTLAVAVAAVLLLGLPLAVVLSRLELNEAGQQLERDATMVAKGMQYRQRGAQTDRSAGDRADAAGPVCRSSGARAWQPSRSAPNPPPETPSDRAPSPGTSTSPWRRTARSPAARLTKALALIGSLGMLSIGVAVGLAFIQARRLSMPLVELAEAAERARVR